MTTSPSHATPTTQQPPSLTNLPEGLSPDSLDTLPVLSALLQRLQNPQSANTGASTAGTPPAATPSQLAAGTGPITLKDVPAATDEMKHKLQRARAQIKMLPDVQRTIAEQEEEMKHLEAKIKEQREMLKHLRELCKSAKVEKEDVTMET